MIKNNSNNNNGNNSNIVVVLTIAWYQLVHNTLMVLS